MRENQQADGVFTAIVLTVMAIIAVLGLYIGINQKIEYHKTLISIDRCSKELKELAEKKHTLVAKYDILSSSKSVTEKALKEHRLRHFDEDDVIYLSASIEEKRKVSKAKEENKAVISSLFTPKTAHALEH